MFHTSNFVKRPNLPLSTDREVYCDDDFIFSDHLICKISIKLSFPFENLEGRKSSYLLCQEFYKEPWQEKVNKLNKKHQLLLITFRWHFNSRSWLKIRKLSWWIYKSGNHAMYMSPPKESKPYISRLVHYLNNMQTNFLKSERGLSQKRERNKRSLPCFF